MIALPLLPPPGVPRDEANPIRFSPPAAVSALANMGRNLIRVRLRGHGVALRPLFVSWEINSVCNLRCSYCYLHQRSYGFYNRGLSIASIKQVMRRIRRACPDVMLLGGEPFLHPNWDEMVRYFRDDLKGRVRCITNGTRLIRHLESVRRLSLLVVSYDQKRCAEYPDEIADMRDQLQRVRQTCPNLTILINFVLCADDDPDWVADQFERFAGNGFNIFVNVDRYFGPQSVDRKIVDALRRLKRRTRRVNMTDTTLDWLRDTTRPVPFRNPTLLPLLDPQARLIYPCCYYNEQNAGSLLDMEYEQLLRASEQRFGRYPFDKCSTCTTTAYLDAAVSVRKPVEGIRHYHSLYNR